jgi:hypothetical protein
MKPTEDVIDPDAVRLRLALWALGHLADAVHRRHLPYEIACHVADMRAHLSDVLGMHVVFVDGDLYDGVQGVELDAPSIGSSTTWHELEVWAERVLTVLEQVTHAYRVSAPARA